MKTSELYNENTLVMFHVGRGGEFNNPGYLTFEDFDKRIDDSYEWSELLVQDTDEDDNLLPEEEWTLTNDNGYIIMEADELKEALETGLGTLDIDEDYNTIYTTYLKDLTEREYAALDNDHKKLYLVIVHGLNEDKLDKIDDDDLRSLVEEARGVVYVDLDWFDKLYNEAIEEEVK